MTKKEHISSFKPWLEYEKSLKKEEKKHLEIPNNLDFTNNKLIIKGYSQLEVLFANNCGLEEVDIDCQSLKFLSLNGNLLQNIDLSKCPNLETLIIANNQLKHLKVRSLKNLKFLSAFNNNILVIDVSNLTNLEKIDISGNCRVEEWGTKGIVYKGLSSFLSIRCINITTLDADMLSLIKLDFRNLVNLRRISIRENNSHRIIIEGNWFVNGKEIKSCYLNSSYLSLVDVKASNIVKIYNREVIYDPLNREAFLTTLVNPDKFCLITNTTYEGDPKDKKCLKDQIDYENYEDYWGPVEDRESQKKIATKIKEKYYQKSTSDSNDCIFSIASFASFLFFIAIYLKFRNNTKKKFIFPLKNNLNGKYKS